MKILLITLLLLAGCSGSEDRVLNELREVLRFKARCEELGGVFSSEETHYYRAAAGVKFSCTVGDIVASYNK